LTLVSNQSDLTDKGSHTNTPRFRDDDRNGITYLFLDTETTGLDPNVDQVWELAVRAAWVTREFLIVDEPFVIQFPIDPELMNPEAAIVNGFNGRYSVPDHTTAGGWAMFEGFIDSQFEQCDKLLLCGINPMFDHRFVTAALGKDPAWHYKPIDMFALAAGAACIYPSVTTNELLDAYAITLRGRHTALGDVDLTIELFSRVYGLEVIEP